ncbi:hypothetical protein WOLCODRAFT_20487 [Wolfiporia cocos MD-104 SS10]|uniref:Plasmid pRiA4b Orf3-like domain-containing protein n=1 Tax=Wolfiporia cocos (strain MD-104) TaxID=742152 RepID=A0A2H3JF80_WOLCO|nr:hypothetical protein WOLCODRAFT_20487 [Wolfiporia cocos MD-104 SS10]
MNLSEMYRMMGGDVPPLSPKGGIPKYVKFVPGDIDTGLPPAFFTGTPDIQAATGTKGVDPCLGNLWEHNLSEYDGVAAMFRQMTYQFQYVGRDDPETQWLKAIMERKRKELDGMDRNGRDKHDVILNVKISFRVSVGLKLSVFQDKVLTPIMGWGGPYSAQRVHAAHVGYDYLADDRYMLAHLFDKEGDQIGYLYDFGDKWHHEITVENIFPREQSHGRVEVLEGKGMCPGENMKGSFAYNESLQKYDKMSPAAQAEWKREVLATPNYDTFGKPPSLFDPDAFDLPAASARLAEALSSPNSVRWGAKKYYMPMIPLGDPARAVLKARDLGKGQKYEHTHDGDPTGGFREETTGERKDRRGQTACAQCGNPDASSLKVCSGCRQVMYVPAFYVASAAGWAHGSADVNPLQALLAGASKDPLEGCTQAPVQSQVPPKMIATWKQMPEGRAFQIVVLRFLVFISSSSSR